MPTIKEQSHEQRFIDVVGRMAEQIVVSSEFRRQLDDIIAGSSTSIKINDDSLDGSVKKLRFFSHDFTNQMKDVSRNFQKISQEERDHPTVKHYEEVLHILVVQIEKQQVLYREKMKDGQVRYLASDDILAKIKNGEFVLKGKSGERKIVIAGTVQPEEVAGAKIKEINISAIAPQVFTEAAKVFNEVTSEADAIVKVEEVSKKEEVPEDTSSGTMVIHSRKQTMLEEEEEEDQSPSLLLLEGTPEEAAMSGFTEGQKASSEREREFREEEKKKDIEDKERKAEIEKEEIKRQELRREVIKEDVEHKELAKVEEESQGPAEIT